MESHAVHNSSTTFGSAKYLWGNVSAIDVLNLKDNENDPTEKNYRLLFVGKDVFPSILGLYYSLAPLKLLEIHEICSYQFSAFLRNTKLKLRRLSMTEVLMLYLGM
jgi:hypothetical protein